MLVLSLCRRVASADFRRRNGVKLAAIAGRPWLMSAADRKAGHTGQTAITLSGLSAHFGKASKALMHASALRKGWATRTAEQFNSTTV